MFTIAVFVLAALVLALTHPIWVIDWWQILPGWLAAYLSPAHGSLFPLFPWATYVLFGAGLGQIYVSWGAARLSSYAMYALFVPGVILSALGWGLAQIENGPWGTDAWNFMPIQLAIRIGACLIILAAIARASQRLTRLPRFFAAVAQETLPIYFVHLMIVYGSIWNSGLAVWYAASLGPSATLLCVACSTGGDGRAGVVLALAETRPLDAGEVDHGRGGGAPGVPASLVQSVLSFW